MGQSFRRRTNADRKTIFADQPTPPNAALAACGGAAMTAYEINQSYSNVVAAISGIYDGKYWHSATITGLVADTTYGVDVVFNGHDHHYERTCPILDGTCTTPQDGGVVYYVTGGGGAPLYSVSGDWFTAYGESLNHFLKVEVNDCWLRLDAIDASGNVFDSYEIHH